MYLSSERMACATMLGQGWIISWLNDWNIYIYSYKFVISQTIKNQFPLWHAQYAIHTHAHARTIMVTDEHWVNKMKIKLNCRMFWKGKANFNWLNIKHMHWTLLNCFHSAHTAAIHTHYPHCNPIRLWMCVRECECIHTEQARFNGPLCDIIIIILCECDYSGRLCVCVAVSQCYCV